MDAGDDAAELARQDRPRCRIFLVAQNFPRDGFAFDPRHDEAAAKAVLRPQDVHHLRRRQARVMRELHQHGLGIEAGGAAVEAGESLEVIEGIVDEVVFFGADDGVVAKAAEGGAHQGTTALGQVPVAETDPVAQVLIDHPVPHLARTFDYAVPASLAEAVRPGVRVRVLELSSIGPGPFAAMLLADPRLEWPDPHDLSESIDSADLGRVLLFGLPITAVLALIGWWVIARAQKNISLVDDVLAEFTAAPQPA